MPCSTHKAPPPLTYLTSAAAVAFWNASYDAALERAEGRPGLPWRAGGALAAAGDDSSGGARARRGPRCAGGTGPQPPR